MVEKAFKQVFSLPFCIKKHNASMRKDADEPLLILL